MEVQDLSSVREPNDEDDMIRQIRSTLLGCVGDRIKRGLLYGSRASGNARGDSDYDILVVEEVPVSKRDEAGRLRRALEHLPMAVDVWVMGEEEFEETKDVIGGLAFPARKYGKDLI
jgi:predicted nucleotidyltransferase